jgi:hypothetical protein
VESAHGKRLLATLRKGNAVKLVADILSESDKFFENVEVACEEIQATAKPKFGGGDSGGRKRAWTELRIRRAELVKDNVTLPIQRLREAVSELIKLSEDKDIGQELVECNRRLGELKVEVAEFLSQQARRPCLLGGTRRQGAQESLAQRRAGGRGGLFAPPVVRERHKHRHDERDAGLPTNSETSNRRNGSQLFFQARRLRIRGDCRSARRLITRGR